jgi:hypothetical protein
MDIERRRDLSLGLEFKLRIAALAHAHHRDGSLDNAEPSLRHGSSLQPSREPVEFKRQHYPELIALAKSELRVDRRLYWNSNWLLS